ncbi:MAG: hypothetical protein PHE78_00325 [Candidatus Gastranaerophilales bacterium]|nr:hypothetical protein [Candidatus Gastranaerophilales bacterium]
MVVSSQNINFKGLYGSYVKNNRKYAINIKQPNTAIEAIKGDDGLYLLKFYKHFAQEKEKIRTLEKVQNLEISKIDDESGAILNSDDTFKIMSIEAYNTFLEIGQKAKVLIEKLESCTLFIHSKEGSKEQRAVIKEVKGLEVRNMHSDNTADVYRAQNLVLSNSNVDERINIKADSITLNANRNIDLLI